MISVLFLCHGNICRSPIAEFVFKSMTTDLDINIKSMALSDEEIGNPIYPSAKQILEEENIPFEDHRSVKMSKEDYNRFDHIIVMEKYNLSRLKGIIGEDTEKKVNLLLDFTDKKGDIEDPWYTGNFKKVFAMIYLGCSGLLDYLKSKKEV